VYKPALMSPDKLQEMYYYAWNTFYKDCSQEVRMAQLFLKVLEKEKAEGTYQRTRPRREGWKGKKKEERSR
jgi:hypothetical protein